jgi:hypothetical protein
MSEYEHAGQGMIVSEFYPFDKATRDNMSLVVEMAKRRDELLAKDDMNGLLALAIEYYDLGAVDTAAQIRAEAE